MWRRRRDGGDRRVLGPVGLRRRLGHEARRGRLGRWGGEDEVGGGGGGGGGAEWGVCVHGVVVRVCVSVGVGLRVRDGQGELAASPRSPRRGVRVEESVRGSRGDGGVRGELRRRRDEAQVVARVLADAMLHPLMLLGMRGNAAGRALPPGGREPVREGVVLRDALHVVAVVVVVRRRRRLLLLLLLLVPSNTDSSSSTAAVAIVSMQRLELGRPPSRTSSPSKSSRVRLDEVGRWGGAWGRGGWVGDGRRGGGVVGGR